MSVDETPVGWPLVERRRRGQSPPPEGVERRRSVSTARQGTTPAETIPLAPFRLAAIGGAILRALPDIGHQEQVLLTSLLVGAIFTGYALIRPLRLGKDREIAQIVVAVEFTIMAMLVSSTGAWNSPLTLMLIPAVLLASVATERRFALSAIVLAGALVTFVHTRGDDSMITTGQKSALWIGFLALICFLGGWVHKTATDNANRQMVALNQVGHLSEANALLSSLHRVAQVLPASLDLDDVLDSTVERVKALIPHDMLTVLLVEENEPNLAAVRASGYPAIEAFTDPEYCPPLAEVLHSRTVVKREYLVHKHGQTRVSVSPQGKSGIYAALSARDQIVGVIAIESLDSRHFTGQDTEILRGLAEPLGIAVDNARLFRKLRIVGADEERNRIARDLHDKIGSSLASLGFGLDATISVSRHGQPVTADLVQLREQVTAMISDVREALYDLRSDVNDGQDLRSTLAQFLDRVKARSGLHVRFAYEQTVRLALLQERELWQIAREAIINAERHAQASALGVDWISTPQRALLVIHDNGVGLQPGSGRADSYGMVGMRERAESIDAVLTTETSSAGTVIRVELRRPAL